MDIACQLFDRMPRQDIVSWIFPYFMEGFNEARMALIKLDKFTYVALCVFARPENIVLGEFICGLITISSLGNQVFLTNSLIDMCLKCGRIDQAWCLFSNFDELDDVSWNSSIASYVQVGSNDELLKVLIQMYQSGFKSNNLALGSVMKACCSLFPGSKEIGKILHVCIIKPGLDLDVVIATDCLICCHLMISGFFRSETGVCAEFADEAQNLFSKIQKTGMKASKFTFSSILKACNVVGAFDYGKQIHAQIFKNNLQSEEFIGNALIDLYSLLGSTEDELRCFHLTLRMS